MTRGPHSSSCWNLNPGQTKMKITEYNNYSKLTQLILTSTYTHSCASLSLPVLTFCRNISRTVSYLHNIGTSNCVLFSKSCSIYRKVCSAQCKLLCVKCTLNMLHCNIVHCSVACSHAVCPTLEPQPPALWPCCCERPPYSCSAGPVLDF